MLVAVRESAKNVEPELELVGENAVRICCLSEIFVKGIDEVVVAVGSTMVVVGCDISTAVTGATTWTVDVVGSRGREGTDAGGKEVVGFILLQMLARMNNPYKGLQSKYLSPCTDPSFFPLGASSSIPTHSPLAKLTGPE